MIVATAGSVSVVPRAGLLLLCGGVSLGLFGVLALYLADGFRRRAFVTRREFSVMLAAVGLVGSGLASGLAWLWPSASSPLLSLGLAGGLLLAGAVLGDVAVLPGWRGGQVGTVLIGGDEALAARLDVCTDRVRMLGRLEVPAEPGRLQELLLRCSPKLILLGGTERDVDFGSLQLCFLEGVRVLVLLEPSSGLMLSRGPIVRLGGFPWAALRPLPLAPRHRRAKRAFDLVATLAALPLVVPVLAVIALGIVADSRGRGGVLYRQTRVGEAGRCFTLIKFRTMRIDAEQLTGPVFAQADDPRATRLGRILRRLHLDELPQLWNVLRGEMSLVGPRPERPELIAQLGAGPEYDLRHLLRPGLTGLAQLVGGYSTSVADKLRCDLLYVSRRSVALDLRLLAATALALVRGFPIG